MESIIAKVSFYVMMVLLVLTLVPIELILIGAGIVGLVVLIQVGVSLRVIGRELKTAKYIASNLRSEVKL